MVQNMEEYSKQTQSVPADFSVLDQTLDSLMEGFQLISMDWRYVYINDAVVKQSGYKMKSELLGYTMMERFPGIEQTKLFKHLEQAMYEGIASNFENEFTFPDGTSRWYELRVQPVLSGLFVLSIDISDRKRAT